MKNIAARQMDGTERWHRVKQSMNCVFRLHRLSTATAGRWKQTLYTIAKPEWRYLATRQLLVSRYLSPFEVSRVMPLDSFQLISTGNSAIIDSSATFISLFRTTYLRLRWSHKLRLQNTSQSSWCFLR